MNHFCRRLPLLIGLVWGVLVWGLESAAAPADGRERVSLNGVWEAAASPVDTPLDRVAGWAPFDVPKATWMNPRDGAEYWWVQRDIEIPEAWRGRRVFIQIGGALYDPHVYIDGRLVGSQFDGWSRIEIELTDAITPGRTHRLAIRCQDQSATFDASVPRTGGFGNDELRGKVLAPIGGYKDHPGIWDDVFLLATPAQRIAESDLVITPSTRRGRLRIEGRVDGALPGANLPGVGMTVEARVLDAGREAIAILPVAVDASGAWALDTPFPDARHWSPEDPHLYHLELVLRSGDGSIIDRLTHRFGFREFWTDGPDFYLNGVKRHLFGTSHWPPSQPRDREWIRGKLQHYKDTHVNVFRPHIGGWQKAWYEIADEIGVLIIPEAPVYTDDFGMYGYNDERFWANYRDNVERMIRHYRNHPSVVIWSLGNETLFMGNARYAEDLPKRLGDLGRFAKTIDPVRPFTYEADIDPDGAYDVIGLHYPHELPDNYAYPNTADWMGRRKRTEAGGGMLGVTRSNFYWDRTKPLYIGEYLWTPHGDFSPGSVFFGEDAYLHREKYANLARSAAHFDQTIAYRRAGVSGLCPWAAAEAPKPFYQPVAAFLWNRDARCFAGERYTFEFDVFNDSTKPLDLTLRLTERDGRAPTVEQSLRLEPAAWRRVPLELATPQVPSPTTLRFDAVLLAAGEETHRTSPTLTAEPRAALATPEGFTLVVFDPRGEWPGSQRDLDALQAADPAKTLLLIAPGALSRSSDDAGSDLPVIGGSAFDTRAFLGFVSRGGRAVVLEQSTLRPLGLGLDLVEHASTMTFPVTANHPLLAGIAPEDLKFWRGDHYVSRYEVRRPVAGGTQAVVVSGGPRSLDQAPVVDVRVGEGRVVLLQALVGEKRETEPAAARLLQNALNHLAAHRPPAGRTVVLTASDAFATRVRELGIDAYVAPEALSPGELDGVALLIVHGGGEKVRNSADAIVSYRAGGGRIYWSGPEPAAFEALAEALGVASLRIEPANVGVAIRDRDAAVLRGVSREDTTYTTVPRSWNRQMTLQPGAAYVFVPDTAGSGQREATITSAENGVIENNAARFKWAGRLTATIEAPGAGLYPVHIRTKGNPQQLPLFVNESLAVVFFDDRDEVEHTAIVELAGGTNALQIHVAPQRGPGSPVTIERIAIGEPAAYPQNVRVLTQPAAIVAIDDGAVVLDGMRWHEDGDNRTRGARYASALLANLGARFSPPVAVAAGDTIPLRAFALVGESPYSDLSESTMTLRSNGVFEASLRCVAAGEYVVRLRGHSTPAHGEHGRVRLLLDGRPVGEVELKSLTSAAFDVGPVRIDAGEHRLGVEFFNDASGGGEDRNVFIEDVSLAPR